MLYAAGFIALFLILWAVFMFLGPLIQRVLAMLGNVTASFRYRDYVPVVVLLAAGLAGTAFAADQFIELAELVRAESPLLQQIDTSIHEWARGQRSAGATLFFTAFTHLGSPVGLAIIVVGVTAVLLRSGRYRWAVYLLATTVIGGLLVLQLKLFFSRTRPDLAVALRSAQGFSFPSGHAMGTTVVFGALCYLILRAHKPWRLRAAGLAFATTIVLAVSLSRVYLGV
ncbi:MAG TPA: phosphatase PAP2 family protein, partial [Thermoanaerobaculia bacterium]|nr:phosphatase PAP2 family protein [Thermoanaerobaculia bacterium]